MPAEPSTAAALVKALRRVERVTVSMERALAVAVSEAQRIAEGFAQPVEQLAQLRARYAARRTEGNRT